MRVSMSKLHSETHNRELDLRIRVKLINLSGTLESAIDRVSKSQFNSVAAIMGERAGRHNPVEAGLAEELQPAAEEICMASGSKIATLDFENHIEDCKVCANRVELQLDFMETLELAVYQRRAQPESQKVHGAMLVSAPTLNFAVCGEIEPV